MKTNANEKNEKLHLDGPRALRSEEYPAALRLINSAFRPERPHAMENEYSLVLGRNNIENMRVITHGDEVISHAAIYCSTLRSGDLAFKVGGISAVATHPSYRGKGLATKVMQDAISVMQERGCQLSFLWTDRHSFYRNLGYEPAGSFYLLKPAPSILSATERDCEIVDYSPERLSEIMEIHDREPLRTERSRKEYETYFSLPEIQTLLALRGGKVSAYAVMGKGRDLRGFMHDWGGNPEDLLCLARELAALSETGELYVLAPACENDFASFLIEMNAPKAYMKLIMIRVIDVEAVSALVREHVSSRAGKDFRIEQDHSGIKILVGREETYVKPAGLLANVIFGPEPPSSFLSGFSRETLSVLDKALPIPLFIWGLDWV